MKEYTIAFEDVEYWAEFAAHPMEFINARAQALKCMKSPRKVTPEHIKEFNKRFKIVWQSDSSIVVVPI